MKLRIITPLTVVLDEPDVMSVRAEDESGSFGILQGHADLVSSVLPSVVIWKRRDGTPHYCAVRQGVLTVTEKGSMVEIATREAVCGDDLKTLKTLVRQHYAALDDARRNANVASVRLQLDAVRRIGEGLWSEAGSLLQ
ncbi:F0F1 ATP synthase subunit epsilon [Gluconobacter sp. R75690]|uniref:F0F1 ATP synthase subunit epsilon n=1 Tax=Gluconobacter TaxID=441 RepID=UPI00188C5687|nr:MULTISPECIES: F0F1 ATP synthase subunit epsilon [unclassified Gluconobacter]MBF0851122.1 F0F1 ATP synthase subunit epsilon [Gluconobacter sp. R75690]MBF0879814.1 F0F1 ATP synthase subunit epsilon [Gluconobacter sp. R75828]